jgi:hypothetical protein
VAFYGGVGQTTLGMCVMDRAVATWVVPPRYYLGTTFTIVYPCG